MVNTNAIRYTVNRGAYIPENEPRVKNMALYMIKSLFTAGHDNVALDACNLTKAIRDTYKDDSWSREFIVMQDDKDTCKSRLSEDEEHYEKFIAEIDAMELEPLEEDETGA